MANNSNFHQLYLSLGGNVGDVLETFQIAKKLITSKIGDVVTASGVYKTAAWGVENQPDFLNQVLLVNTKLSPTEVLTQALVIEKELGRVRLQKWGERTLDIDLLFYDDSVLEEEHLIVPHPRISERKFILIPLKEISENLQHPVLKKTVSQLLSECNDVLKVEKL